MARAADTHGDAPALQAEDGTTGSFEDLDREVLRVARALLATGIEPGDRIGIWAPNVATWVFAALGVHAAGGTLVPLNTRYRGREAADILRAWSRDAMANFKVPRRVEVVDELPRNPSGKVLKHELRARVA